VKKLTDDLMLFDNTAHSRDVRLVAHFQAGKLVKLAREIPKWTRKGLGREFTEWLKPNSWTPKGFRAARCGQTL